MFAVRASAAAALKNVAAAAANAQRNVVAASATRAASTIAADNRFMARLDSGDTIICAEGYLFEMERRGYVQIGKTEEGEGEGEGRWSRAGVGHSVHTK